MPCIEFVAFSCTVINNDYIFNSFHVRFFFPFAQERQA